MQPANKRFLQLVREVNEHWRTPSGVPWRLTLEASNEMSTHNRSCELLKYRKRILNILLIGSVIENLVRVENQIFCI
jgi:hypothetical protein